MIPHTVFAVIWQVKLADNINLSRNANANVVLIITLLKSHLIVISGKQ